MASIGLNLVSHLLANWIFPAYYFLLQTQKTSSEVSLMDYCSEKEKLKETSLVVQASVLHLQKYGVGNQWNSTMELLIIFTILSWNICEQKELMEHTSFPPVVACSPFCSQNI